MLSRFTVWARPNTMSGEWVKTYDGSSVVGAVRALLRAKWRGVDAHLVGGEARVSAGAVRLEWR